MGHGRGQPDRLPLARPLARSPTRGEQGTRQVGRGHGTRATREDRPPVQPPPAWLPHPTPPHPAPTRSSGGEAPGVGGRREHRRAAARGSTSRRARGRAGGAGRGRERRTTTTRPRDPTGRGERTRRGAEDRRRRRRAAGEGATRRKTRRSPPDRQGPPLPPPLSLHATSRACAAKTPHDRRVAGSRAPNPLERHQNPAGSGARGTARPQPGGKRAAAEGHRGVPRATTGARIPGARPRARHGLGASRPPRQGEALFGGARGAEGTPGGAADRGREPAGHRRHRRRRVGGARQTGGGGGPDSTPRPISRGLPAARRGDSARRPHPTPGETHHAQKTACGARRLPKGRRRPRPTASARALWSVSSLSRAARAPPRPRSRRRPPPANPPHRPTRAPSSERAAGAGRGGVGCGADTAGGRGGAPVSALRGTKGTRRPCEDTPAAPPPERETPRGWRLIVKRRSDRRSPGRNPGPQVRSKCR